MDRALLLTQAGSTLALCGLIWFVQVVHYPLFARVGHDEFAGYEREHVRRTGWVVGPLMIAEGLSALFLCLRPPPGVDRGLLLTGLALLLSIWVSTAALQVPEHNRLTIGFAPIPHRRLVGTNWIRTTLWTARAAIVITALSEAVR